MGLDFIGREKHEAAAKHPAGSISFKYFTPIRSSSMRALSSAGVGCLMRDEPVRDMALLSAWPGRGGGDWVRVYEAQRTKNSGGEFIKTVRDS